MKIGQSDFDGEVDFVAPEPEPIGEADARVTPAIREGLWSLDLVHLFSMRAVVMKSRFWSVCVLNPSNPPPRKCQSEGGRG